MRSKAAILFTMLVLVPACGGSSLPTAPPPVPDPLTGRWDGSITLSSITGEQCLASLWQNQVGKAFAYSADMTQSGTRLTAVTIGGGWMLHYTGSAGTSDFTLKWNGGDGGVLPPLHCSDGATRYWTIADSSIAATIPEIEATGTETKTLNVYEQVAGPGPGGSMRLYGSVVITSNFTLTKRLH